MVSKALVFAKITLLKREFTVILELVGAGWMATPFPTNRASRGWLPVRQKVMKGFSETLRVNIQVRSWKEALRESGGAAAASISVPLEFVSRPLRQNHPAIAASPRFLCAQNFSRQINYPSTFKFQFGTKFGKTINR
jgi:hypothetical protein